MVGLMFCWAFFVLDFNKRCDSLRGSYEESCHNLVVSIACNK